MATGIRTVRETARAIRDGKVSAAQCVEEALAAADRHAALNAFITLDVASTRAAALAADIYPEKKGALFGVPIAVKDNIATAGMPTSAGTPALKGWIPTRNAPVWQRLLDEGAILFGKTNMHELAFGITSANPAFGDVGNAVAPNRFAGGSSGGTGAAIGVGIVAAGLGTDTGGSVRIPAALNGIAALRPTKGRYPGEGVVPISATLDTPGPMARCVDDLVLLDGIITRTSANLDALPLDQVRLGLPLPFISGIEKETRKVFEAAVHVLETAGVTFVPIAMDGLAEINAKVGFPVALGEFKRDLTAFLSENETGLTIEDVAAQVATPRVGFVMRELVLGARAMPAAVYTEAMGVHRPGLQTLYAETFAAHRLDGILFPTTPLPAQAIAGSDETVMLNGEAAPTFDIFIRNTEPGANAGIPGLAIPAGVTSDGLPVGIEIDGPAFSDKRLLAIGLSIELTLAAAAHRQNIKEPDRETMG